MAFPPLVPTAPPFPAVRGHNNPQGSNDPISISRHSAAKISLSGGDAAAGGRRGAFPTGEARLYGSLSVTAINSNCPKSTAPIVHSE